MKFCALMIVVMLGACTDASVHLSGDSPKIKSAIEARKASLKAEIMENCKLEIIEKAIKYVDSLVAVEIDFQLSDSIVFPPKPIKPASPGPIIIPDTIRARPIFLKK